MASKFLAVGSAVPAAVAQVGAIATQADANVAFKGLALAHLDEGATAPVAGEGEGEAAADNCFWVDVPEHQDVVNLLTQLSLTNCVDLDRPR